MVKKNALLIFQYDDSGKYLALYPSIHEAERQTGIGSNLICASANGRQLTAGGFYWRHNKVKQIDTDAILNKRQEHRREARGTKVTQYNLKGNPIAWFNSLADAAEAIHRHYTPTSADIRRKIKQPPGFNGGEGIIRKRLKQLNNHHE